MKDPLLFLSPYHGIDPRQGSRYYPRWADHHVHTPFHADDGQWCSQPYSLDSDALDDFAILRANGYRIRIDGHSEHFQDCLTVIIKPLHHNTVITNNSISAPSRSEGEKQSPDAVNIGACSKDQQ
ncbi:MAG: hypothetical protein ABF489_02495 [Bifidobacterium sp.]|uniref:hypothetical protein n=1 Tax=Bifidobacterium sp. TaxID=41200 RepID=UPI0039EAF7A4